METRRIVIIGYGMAGTRLADHLRQYDPTGDSLAVTIIGAEQHPGYNRILLSNVIAGSVDLGDTLLHQREWADKNAVELRLGVSAVRIDRDSHQVLLSDGSAVAYDDLVLATGSEPWIPPTEGLRTESGSLAEGVVAFRSLEDCRRILDRVLPGTPVAVLGGGLLGLEAARALAGRGNPVTVVHPVGHLMERQLDPQAGAVLARVLSEMGIELRLGQLATQYVVDKGLELDDGSMVEAGLVVVSAGARPATGLALECGLAVDDGVLVDNKLRTSDPHIRAIGDCAQHPGTVSGLVQPAWEQAKVLADLLTGINAAASYLGTRTVARLKARNIDLATMGEVHVQSDCADAEVVRLEDPKRGRYAKIVLRNDRITGAIVLGAPDAAATITQLHDRDALAPSDRYALLLGRALPIDNGENAIAPDPAHLPGTTVICRCNTVHKDNVIAAWRCGAQSIDDVVDATRASTGCGGCRGTVDRLCSWLSEHNQEKAGALGDPH